MIRQIVSLLASARKIAPLPLLGTTIACAVILFIPPGLAEPLGMDRFRGAYRSWIGFALIVSFSLLAAHIVGWLVEIYTTHRRRARTQQVRQGYLDNLTPDEKTYLAPYVLEEVTSQVFELEDGIAGGLVAKNIIYRSSNLGNVLEGFPYNMQPWARDYLHQHLELLQGAAARPNQRDRHW